MNESGVFHETGNYNTYFTCCCRVKIFSDQTKCPQCQQSVIPYESRYHFTHMAEYQAFRKRLEDRYVWSGRGQAEIVAARLKGEAYIMPHLCSGCGNPEEDCGCTLY